MKKHLDFKIRNEDWCIIKLEDGARLRVLTILTAAIQENKEIVLGTQNIIAVASLPDTLWGQPEMKGHTLEELEKGIIKEDMNFEIEKENWNVYELEDGTVVSIKPYVVTVSRTKYYNERGEPIYLLNIQPIIKVKPRKK